jgi:stage V sporulation protein B
MLFLLYLCDKKNISRLSGRERPPFAITKQILHISVPITAGKYLNSLLRTAENVLVPKNLSKYSASQSNALSIFGMIKGMALPILFFPSAILNSVSTLLIPEISEAVAKNQHFVVKNACERIFKLTLLVGLLFGSIFFTAGSEIGLLIYNDSDVGFLLKALSPIVPLMYLDSICDGVLKGLDQQNFTFRTSLSDSALRIILILLLLPKTGLWGFIGIMYFSNLYTCLLNVGRLVKITKVKLDYAKILVMPFLLSLTTSFLSRFLLLSLGIKNNIIFTLGFCVLSCFLYLILVFSLKISKKDDFLR